MDQVMSIEAALAVADEVSPTPARAVTALKVLRTALLAATDTTESPPEALASRLIDAWCEIHQMPVPWQTAVEIIAIVTRLPDAERERLLRLADGDGVPHG